MSDIARIRRFNRAVTRETGAMEDSFLGRGRPLGAARVLWAIAEGGRDVADSRAELSLDSGLMSSLLRGLEAEGLAVVETDPSDRRRRRAVLTATGLAEKAEYDRLNDAMAARLLGLPEGECAIKKGAIWWLRSRERDGADQTVVVAVLTAELT